MIIHFKPSELPGRLLTMITGRTAGRAAAKSGGSGFWGAKARRGRGPATGVVEHVGCEQDTTGQRRYTRNAQGDPRRAQGRQEDTTGRRQETRDKRDKSGMGASEARHTQEARGTGVVRHARQRQETETKYRR